MEMFSTYFPKQYELNKNGSHGDDGGKLTVSVRR